MSKSRKEDRPFTGTEVGAVLESLRNDISAIAEGQVALRADVDILRTDVGEIKDRLVIVEDTIRVSLPDIFRRLTHLEAKSH